MIGDRLVVGLLALKEATRFDPLSPKLAAAELRSHLTAGRAPQRLHVGSIPASAA